MARFLTLSGERSARRRLRRGLGDATTPATPALPADASAYFSTQQSNADIQAGKAAMSASEKYAAGMPVNDEHSVDYGLGVLLANRRPTASQRKALFKLGGFLPAGGASRRTPMKYGGRTLAGEAPSYAEVPDLIKRRTARLAIIALHKNGRLPPGGLSEDEVLGLGYVAYCAAREARAQEKSFDLGCGACSLAGSGKCGGRSGLGDENLGWCCRKAFRAVSHAVTQVSHAAGNALRQVPVIGKPLATVARLSTAVATLPLTAFAGKARNQLFGLSAGEQKTFDAAAKVTRIGTMAIGGAYVAAGAMGAAAGMGTAGFSGAGIQALGATAMGHLASIGGAMRGFFGGKGGSAKDLVNDATTGASSWMSSFGSDVGQFVMKDGPTIVQLIRGPNGEMQSRTVDASQYPPDVVANLPEGVPVPAISPDLQGAAPEYSAGAQGAELPTSSGMQPYVAGATSMVPVDSLSVADGSELPGAATMPPMPDGYAFESAGSSASRFDAPNAIDAAAIPTDDPEVMSAMSTPMQDAMRNAAEDEGLTVSHPDVSPAVAAVMESYGEGIQPVDQPQPEQYVDPAYQQLGFQDMLRQYRAAGRI